MLVMISVLFMLGSGGCTSTKPGNATPLAPLAPAIPIRFLLTFDDGPSARARANPTVKILDTLAKNRVQPGIKAIFFVQTRAIGAGGSVFGRTVMRRQHREGHVLGFHTATATHESHRSLSPAVLEQSLIDGIADIKVITGIAPKLIRPPYWNYDQRTFESYSGHSMRILMTDLSAHDGKTVGFNASNTKRENLHAQLARFRDEIAASTLPVVDGAIPVVVTFHDLNDHTAANMGEYLRILPEIARDLQLPLAARPFYDRAADVEKAALARSEVQGSVVASSPGSWDWLHKIMMP